MKHYLKDFFNEIANLPEREQIIAFCKKFEDSPKQGTEEWLKERKVGGSDAYKAINDKNFLKNRLKPFKKNLIMEWGNLMEPVVVEYLSQYMEIFTTNSVPGFGDNEKNYTSYSPDGIIYGGEIYGLSGINLLEIKCPAIRAPSELPNIYKPQIQLGLATLEFCKKCFYVECYAKTCSLTNFCFNKYTSNYSKYNVSKEPIAIGFVSFFGEFEFTEPFEFIFPESLSFIPKKTKSLCENRINFDGIDFGSRDSCFYKTANLKTYDYKKKYSPLLFNEPQANPAEFFEKEYSKIGGDGVLCYKIFDFNKFIVEKENFEENIKKLVKIGKVIFG